jgi:hypothetical protein
MMAAISASGPTLDRARLLRQNRIQILRKKPVIFAGELHNLREFLQQVIGSYRRFSPQRCSNCIQAIPFRPQKGCKSHFGQAKSLCRKILSIRFHTTKIDILPNYEKQALKTRVYRKNFKKPHQKQIIDVFL